MIRTAAHSGARAAALRFGVREASALEFLLGTLGAGVGGKMVQGAMDAAAPRLGPALMNAGAAPVNALRRAVSGPKSPADLLVKQLSKAEPMMHARPPIPAMGAPIK